MSNTQQVFGGGQNLFTAGPVSIPEADINWDYALIVRVDPVNYNTHIIPFNLKKAIAGDIANNIKLKPGDIVNVLSTKDVRKSISSGVVYVFIDGEVNSPGVYELHTGQTLKDVIESAGGASTSAYVFGLELNRDSVRKQQTAALNQMLDQAQQSILAQSASVTNVTSSDQAQMQQMAVQQQIALISKMREVKPTGRIVLNLQSASTKVSDLPDFRLENGDTIYIPPIPDTVNVIGQVYNPATFIYKPDYSVGKYINLAGTENQYADTSVEYVLRADGTLYSKQQAGWFGSFAGRTLNPGDVIIVPQEAQIGGAIQNLLNWTQILSNFGTAAAAITVFKN
jgi:protein involved in polysaccharide export with SLBB domain